MTTPPTALMITPARRIDGAPAVRRVFALDQGHGPVAEAVVLATALGVCEVRLNGEPVSADLLTPGWTSYEWRLRYARWDATPILATAADGPVVIEAVIGSGWYSGHLGWDGNSEVYGDERAALVELRIVFADGHVQVVGTDESWTSLPTATTADDLYDGQRIDRRIDDAARSTPAPVAGEGGVRVVPFDHARLTPYVSPPVRRQEEIAPVRVWRSPAGALLVDFGQNLVGWTRLSVRGEAGQEVVVRHAEVLEDGELGTRPLRKARATDAFVLSGGDDVFEPTLTFHGFRYAEVTGWPGEDDALAGALRAVVIGSDLVRTGTFRSSHALLNRLHENVVWGMRGNFVDVPTDCPQRDERLGWTGDLAAFAETAVYLYDSEAFLADWLRDLAIEQEHADGRIPVVVPDNLKYEKTGALAAVMGSSLVIALWNDAACWVPWAMYEAYGDSRVLADQYASMTGHVRRTAGALSPRDLLEGGFQLGDWLDPTAPPDAPHQAKADPAVVATACVYRSVVIARDAAQVLGHEADAAEFDALAQRIRTAFSAHWVEDGRIRSDAPTVYALAIVFGLLDDADRAAAGSRLAALVADAGYVITTGFAGTPFILTALSDTGHLETAYRLLLQEQCPSWLYPVTMGATTMWERWDSMLPDGTINPGEMTSFNHYAFGAVATWLHRVVAGLAPVAPGYARVRIAPRPPAAGLTSAETALESRHGRIATGWSLDGGVLRVNATIPDGVVAEVSLPSGTTAEVGTGAHEWTEPFAAAGDEDAGADSALDAIRTERERDERVLAKARLLGGASFWTTAEGEGVRSLTLVDGPHGLRYQDGATDHLGVNDSRPATCFPPAVAIGSSWNPALAEEIGAAIGREAREVGVDVVLGPGINIKRSPLGGRGFEYFSEDPLLTGVLGSAWVQGLQGTGVGASLKHFAVNSQETDRMRVDAVVDQRALREIYLPAFERIVREARPATVMSAYNAINGVFASENPWLLTELLRGEWGFDGLVVSDWGAVKDRVEALRAGLDLEMPASGDAGAQAILEAVRTGALDETVIDEAVARLAALADRTAASAPAVAVDPEAHHALARRAAGESIVLLRNEADVLPLAGATRVGIFGHLAVAPQFQGGGSSHVNPTRIDAPLDELRSAFRDTAFALGYAPDGDASGLRAEAAALAAGVEVAVVFAGLYETDQTEGRDRTDLALPADQVALIRAVAEAAPRTVVVLMNGGVVELEPWHDDVAAIVEAWAGGQAVGGALADVLSGAVNPSGRLAETIPLDLRDTSSALAFPGESGTALYGESVFVGYRHHVSTGRAVRYAFGHGLSYTAFTAELLAAEPVSADGATVRVRVRNDGDRAGAEVVQIYAGQPGAPVRRPLRALAGFAKVALEPGESREVVVELDRRAFAYWDVRADAYRVDGGVHRIELGRSSVEILAAAEVVLEGDAPAIRPLTLESTVGEWFTHPVVGPALRGAMGADPDSEPSADLSLVASMPMGQFVRFLDADIPEAVLHHFMALSAS